MYKYPGITNAYLSNSGAKTGIEKLGSKIVKTKLLMQHLMYSTRLNDKSEEKCQVML